MIKILFVCLGNICRSPMAESIMTNLIKEKGLSEDFIIDSKATSDMEVGNPIHNGTIDVLNRMNIPIIPHKSTKLVPSDLNNYDYIIGMEDANVRDIKKILKSDDSKKIFKLLDFTNGKDIADPWYTNDFDTTYNDINDGCLALIDYLYH